MRHARLCLLGAVLASSAASAFRPLSAVLAASAAFRPLPAPPRRRLSPLRAGRMPSAPDVAATAAVEATARALLLSEDPERAGADATQALAGATASLLAADLLAVLDTAEARWEREGADGRFVVVREFVLSFVEEFVGAAAHTDQRRRATLRALLDAARRGPAALEAAKPELLPALDANFLQLLAGEAAAAREAGGSMAELLTVAQSWAHAQVEEALGDDVAAATRLLLLPTAAERTAALELTLEALGDGPQRAALVARLREVAAELAEAKAQCPDDAPNAVDIAVLAKSARALAAQAEEWRGA